LPIGGLKEKLLAAHRGGLRTVLIPRDNERELSEIPDNIKRGLNIIPVTMVDEVLRNALVTELTPIEWDEDAELQAAALAPAQGDEDEVGGVLTH
jgi:ATP-dependent Lon protease